MTKGRFYSIILILLLMVCQPSAAASRKKNKAQNPNRNYIDLHAGAGYTSLLRNTPGASVLGGGGFLVGAGYEFNRKDWLLNIGVEFQFHNSTTHMPDFNTSLPYYYTPLPDYIITYGYDATNVKCTQNTGMVTIPLSFGYRFFKRYYAMVGVKMEIGVFGTNRTKAQIHVNVTDPELAEPLENIGHMTGTSPYDNSSRWTVGFSLAPKAEIGLYLDEWLVKEKKRKYRAPSYRLGLFAEYGVLDIDTKNAVASSAVHPLMVGVHFTALLSLDKAPKERKPRTPKPLETQQPPKPVQPQEPIVEDTIRYGDMEIIKEQPLVLENLMFVFGTADIIPESTGTLDQLLSLMLERRELHIHITGHTDNVGTDAYNKRLSIDRAKAVYTYLQRHGVAAQRMTYSGEGADKPIDTNDTEEGRQLNRRVEITVIR